MTMDNTKIKTVVVNTGLPVRKNANNLVIVDTTAINDIDHHLAMSFEKYFHH